MLQELACVVTSFVKLLTKLKVFLFSFLIEYSLVTSCLLFFLWNKFGKNSPPGKHESKSYHRFHGKHLGCIAAIAVLLLTLVFFILLNTTASDKNCKTYATETEQLHLYYCFLLVLESVMLLATMCGFYLFHRIRRPLKKGSMLDQVLLVVCMTGSLLNNTLSLSAVINGNDNKHNSFFSNEAYSTAKFIKKVFNGSRRGSMTPAENSRAETTKTSAISPFTDNFDKISAHQSSLESEENFQESDASISNNTLSSSSIGSRIIEK